MIILLNLINSLNNAILLNKNKLNIIKFNTLSLRTLAILQKLNIIESFIISSDFKKCSIFLNKNFSKIIAISKPNRYIYYSLNDLIKLRSTDLFNDYIVSINNKENTIVTIDDAIYLHKGGLLLFKILKTN